MVVGHFVPSDMLVSISLSLISYHALPQIISLVQVTLSLICTTSLPSQMRRKQLSLYHLNFTPQFCSTHTCCLSLLVSLTVYLGVGLPTFTHKRIRLTKSKLTLLLSEAINMIILCNPVPIFCF